MKLNSKPKPIIQKIKFTKEQQQEIDRIMKHEPVKRTLIYRSNSGHTTERVTNKILAPITANKKLKELYGNACCICGQWPSYKVLYDMQGAKRIERYCEKDFKIYFNFKKRSIVKK